MTDERHVEGYEPRWDLDAEIGRQGAFWVADVAEALKRGSVEVKTDEIAHRTGNVYVEFECLRRGQYRPSGIATTEAELWVFVLHRYALALVVATDFLRPVAREVWRDGHVRECTRGSHPTRGVVVPISRLVGAQPSVEVVQ